MNKVSFVIPCYSSGHSIEAVVHELIAAMEELVEYKYEVIMVNDCSPDDTMDIIRGICIQHDNMKGIDLSKNFGQHGALMAGLNYVSGDIVVCLDDDGQTPASEVGKLLKKIGEGYDVVYAEYNNKQHSGFRNLGSKINSLMTEYLLDKPRGLFVSSYFAVRRYIVDDVIQYQNAYPYVLGLVLRSTKNIANVEVKHRERIEGNSGYTLKKLVGLWVNGFTSFSVKPLRFATIVGCFFAMIGFLFVIYLVVHKLLHPGSVLMGWSSTMSVIMILGGLILLVLGMIGEYIGRIYICINKAPQYIIKEIVGDKSEK